MALGHISSVFQPVPAPRPTFVWMAGWEGDDDYANVPLRAAVYDQPWPLKEEEVEAWRERFRATINERALLGEMTQERDRERALRMEANKQREVAERCRQQAEQQADALRQELEATSTERDAWQEQVETKYDELQNELQAEQWQNMELRYELQGVQAQCEGWREQCQILQAQSRGEEQVVHRTAVEWALTNAESSNEEVVDRDDEKEPRSSDDEKEPTQSVVRRRLGSLD